MKRIALVSLLSIAVAGCASTRAADLSAPQSKPKTVAVAKAKPRAVAVPVSNAPQPATTSKKKTKKEKQHWWQLWR